MLYLTNSTPGIFFSWGWWWDWWSRHWAWKDC